MSQLDILIFFIQIGLFFWLSWSLILVISNLVLPHYLMLNQSKNVFWFNLNNILLILKMFYILLKLFYIRFFNKHLKTLLIFFKNINNFFFLKEINMYFFFKIFHYYDLTFFNRFFLVSKIKKIKLNFLLFKKKKYKFILRFLNLNLNLKEIKIIFIKRKIRFRSFFDKITIVGILENILKIKKGKFKKII